MAGMRRGIWLLVAAKSALATPARSILQVSGVAEGKDAQCRYSGDGQRLVS